MRNIWRYISWPSLTGLSKPTFSFLLVAGALQLCGCGKIEDFGLTTDQSLLDRSADLPAYTDSQVSAMPRIRASLGEVRLDVCKYRYNPPSVGQQASLAQLRARAAALGANGIAHVRFALITNNRSPCWHGFDASGVAVIFDSANTRASLP